MNQWFQRAAALAGLAGWLLAGAPARADIVTYNNGKTLKGIVEEMPQDPSSLMVTTELGKIQILRLRVKDIQKESPAQGYVEIGQGYFDRGKFADAMAAFQHALSLDPNNPEAKRQIDATQARISSANQMTRNQAVQKIDAIEKQTRDMISKGDFDSAVAQLQEAGRLVPEPDQKLRLQKLISELYLAWAAERQDKFDKTGAEKMLGQALAADPTNQEVIDKMLQMWEHDPSKRDQVANVYETLLERNPNDAQLHKKLADLYWDMGRTEDAVLHYLQLYKTSDQWKGTQLETRLIEGLDKLHLQYARAKNYDRAIEYYKVLATIDPKTDPSAIINYEYLKRSSALKPDDLTGRLALAQFAQKNGLDKEALDTYKRMLDDPKAKDDPKLHEGAQAGIDHYAQAALAIIQVRLQSGDYLLARTLADQARQDYPTSTKVQATLTELIGKINAEIAADTRKKEVLAKDVLKRADEFYATAMQHFNDILNTQRTNDPLLSSPREDAKRYFQYAIQAYQEALSIDPSLGQSNSIVGIRLAECQEYYRRLTAVLPPQRYVPNITGNQ